MILLREVALSDVKAVQALSKIAAEKNPGFLNLSTDADLWKEKIKLSVDSFSEKIADRASAKFIFVAEDTKKKKIVGMSQVAAQHGTPDSPHFYFEVDSEQKYSKTINTGFIHGTLKLKYDTNGPSEIGGLIVDPDYRNHSERIGRQISFVRFLYMGMHKTFFKRRVLAELLPPLTKKGLKSALWEAVGRRFTNMEYFEADELSAKNKEFILSLFPSGRIYTTFLPADARNAIGKVSKDTESVLHMLNKIGFKYNNQVDPFDGGPHVWANFDEILPIKNQRQLAYSGEISQSKSLKQAGIVTSSAPHTKFVAQASEVRVQDQKVFFSKETAKILSVKPGDPVRFMPYY